MSPQDSSSTPAALAHQASAVIVGCRQVSGRDRNDQALFVLDLSVVLEDRTPQRTRVCVPVADDALDAVYPGAELAVHVANREVVDVLFATATDPEPTTTTQEAS